MLARDRGRARPAPLLESERGGRRTIAAGESYGDADRVVETLAQGGFPVEQLAILAPDMRYLPRRPGRRDAVARVLLAVGWAAGVGAAVGPILDLFEVVDPRGSDLVLALWGAGIGAVLGAVGALVRRLVDTSPADAVTGRIVASRFEVVGDARAAEQAGRVLDASPWR